MGQPQKDRAVLVTGASTGIGRTTALELDQLGYRVFASVRSQRDAEDLQAETSGRLAAVLLDVTDSESIFRLREKIERDLAGDGLAGLVNNAGISLTAPLEFMPMDKMRQIFEVNVFGLLAVTQAFLPLLRQGRGRIINISSIASLLVSPFHGPYSASKMSVNAISDALRLEIRPFGVQVSVILCGSVQTPIWQKGGRLSREVVQTFPPAGMALYGGALRRTGQFFKTMGSSGSPPQAASKVIIRALTARRPRNNYLVGADARLYLITNRLITGKLRDWLILRMVGLNGGAEAL